MTTRDEPNEPNERASHRYDNRCAPLQQWLSGLTGNTFDSCRSWRRTTRWTVTDVTLTTSLWRGDDDRHRLLLYDWLHGDFYGLYLLIASSASIGLLVVFSTTLAAATAALGETVAETAPRVAEEALEAGAALTGGADTEAALAHCRPSSERNTANKKRNITLIRSIRSG